MKGKASRVREVPGVIYAPLECRARIQGTGIEPWLVAMTYETTSGDWEAVRAAFDWLTEEQLRAAMAFCDANPEMMRERIEQERALDLEEFWQKYPQTAPKRH